MVFVVSDPPGALARSSLGPSCTTPCGLDVGRRDAFTVTIEKAGFQPQTVMVTTRLNALGVGDMMENATTAGLGAVVDAATGAELEHVPDPVTVTLRPLRLRDHNPSAAPGVVMMSVRGGRARILGAAMALLMGSGCAMLERGTKDQVYVVTDPEGATATSSGGPGRCVAPCGIDVDRTDALTISVEKEGYEPQSLPVKTRSVAPPGATSRDITADYIGRVVDQQTGANLVHDPNPVGFKLVKSGEPTP